MAVLGQNPRFSQLRSAPDVQEGGRGAAPAVRARRTGGVGGGQGTGRRNGKALACSVSRCRS